MTSPYSLGDAHFNCTLCSTIVTPLLRLQTSVQRRHDLAQQRRVRHCVQWSQRNKGLHHREWDGWFGYHLELHRDVQRMLTILTP
jgi:hypothetical protein